MMVRCLDLHFKLNLLGFEKKESPKVDKANKSVSRLIFSFLNSDLFTKS